MFSQYVELKDVPSLQGSLNIIVSNQNHLRRPPSLSESFALEPTNVERAIASNYGSATSLMGLERNVEINFQHSISQDSHGSHESHESLVSQQQSRSSGICSTDFILNNIFRFLFHITLISLFESVFFFFYVSTLEDNGIIKTVDDIIGGVVQSCQNFTEPERIITNDLLSIFINSSQLIEAGNQAQQIRTDFDIKVFNRAWIYVGSLSGLLTIFVVLVAKYRPNTIKWAELMLENVGLVLMLAFYEYMFFATIIVPFRPITGAEIERNTIQELQNECGLLDGKN